MWNPNIKAIHITKLVQMIFKAWFGYFECIFYLPRGMMLIVLNYCFDLIAVNFNWSTQLWSIIQWEICSTKLLKPLLTRSISPSTFSIHCTNLFLRFSYVFTFLEIIKHNMPKMLLFSSIFNVKMATQKFTNFDKFFFLMYADMTAVTYNLTKLFRMKLKTTKCY